MLKQVKYTPKGNNPDDIVLSPPLVHEITKFNAENGYVAMLPEIYADKIVKDNPAIFKIVPYSLPEQFTAEDLENIFDLNELVDIGYERFGMDIDPAEGMRRVKEILLEARNQEALEDENFAFATEESLSEKTEEQLCKYAMRVYGKKLDKRKTKTALVEQILELQKMAV